MVPENTPDKEVAKFGIAACFAYGKGKHNSSLTIHSDSSVNTNARLELTSLTNVEDTKYSSIADIACGSDLEGSKFETSIAFLGSNYDYTSQIIMDDSDHPNKIYGKEVFIESKVYQPYNRPQKMVDDLVSAADKVAEYFTKEGHADTIKRLKESFKKFNTLVVDPSHLGSEGNIQQLEEKWREATDIFDALINFAKKEGIFTKDGIIGRLLSVVKDVLEFKEYSIPAAFAT